MTPISLSDENLKMIMRFAEPLTAMDRSRFLHDMVHELRNYPVIGDDLTSVPNNRKMAVRDTVRKAMPCGSQFKSRSDDHPATRVRAVSATSTSSDGVSATARLRRSRGSKLDVGVNFGRRLTVHDGRSFSHSHKHCRRAQRHRAYLRGSQPLTISHNT